MTPESILSYPYPALPSPGGSLAVAPGVHWLRMPLPFALNHINLWLLEDEGGWTVVDSGLGSAATRALWDEFFGSPAGAQPLRRVIVTHHHPDHAGNAGWLTRRFGVDLWMSHSEFLSAHALLEPLNGFSHTQRLAMFARNGLEPEHLRKLRDRGNGYRIGVPEFPSAYRRLSDGLMVRIGGRDWRVIMGYGHSPEHAALHCEELQVLISGDMVLPKITTNVSVVSIEPEGNPLKLFLDSLGRFAALPAETLVLPSHGLPFVGLRERIAQLDEHHRLRLAELLEACERPQSAAAVIPTLFRRELDAHQLYFAMGEAMAHLHFLRESGQVSREVHGGGIFRFVRAT
ncbi:MAG: MBL fold metallo-hydrolase [Betaproteobacteria bacterium]|nr:MBL fold metallo-hydrolase [Betaproteobacteria bacterium]